MKTLKEAYRPYFKIGAAVPWFALEGTEALIRNQFDSLTCENEMKLASIRDRELGYHFEKADLLYDFAMNNGLEMRGHNLIWHQQCHHDLLEKMSPDALLALMIEHITTVGKRYDRLSCWDVVNEAVSDKPDEYLRDSVWKAKFGEDFVCRFFGLTRELLPSARLVYNDYNEFIPQKREKILRLVRDLKSEGVIDVVGLQCHINTRFCTLDDLKRTMEEYAACGLPLQITELDIGMPCMDDPTPLSEFTPEQYEAHAQLYGDLFKLFREYHEVIESVTFWGVSDDLSWLNWFHQKRECTALLFGKDHKPNEAYARVTEF